MLTDTEKAQLDKQGFTLLPDVISTDEVGELRRLSVVLAANERASRHGAMYLDDRAQRVWNLVNKGEPV